MTIPVPIADLAALLEHYDSAYLVTSTGTGPAKVVTVDPVVDGGVIVVAPSRGSAANLAVNAAATLVWPPPERHGFTLIVDGTAVAGDAGITVTPEHGILHRPRAHAGGPPAPYPLQPNPNPSCGHDCAPITPESTQS